MPPRNLNYDLFLAQLRGQTLLSRGNLLAARRATGGFFIQKRAPDISQEPVVFIPDILSFGTERKMLSL